MIANRYWEAIFGSGIVPVGSGASNAGEWLVIEGDGFARMALAETMRRTGRVFQAGTQRRSVPHFQFAVQLAQSGKLGKLTSLHAHPGGMGTGMSGWGQGEPEPNREEADWDLWLGPAAWRPYNEAYCNGRWRGM